MSDVSDLKTLRERLGWVEVAVMPEHLSLMLCSVFDDPDEEVDDETGWGPSAINGSDAVLDAIHAHYAPALEAQATEMERLRDQSVRREAMYKMMEDFIRAVASKKYDGEMYMTNPPKPVISYTAQRIVDALDAALQEAKDTGQ